MSPGGTLILPVREGFKSHRTLLRNVVELAEEPSMSTTSDPETSGQDEPDSGEAQQPEYQEKSSPGVEIGMMPEGEGSSFEPEEDPEAQT